MKSLFTTAALVTLISSCGKSETPTPNPVEVNKVQNKTYRREVLISGNNTHFYLNFYSFEYAEAYYGNSQGGNKNSVDTVRYNEYNLNRVDISLGGQNIGYLANSDFSRLYLATDSNVHFDRYK